MVGLLESARNKVVRSVNQTMVFTYCEIGRMIVEEEQGGNNKAEYGKSLLKELSRTLTREFGKGFSETNLKQMRQFYLIYSKSQTLSDDSQQVSEEFEKQIRQTTSDQFSLSWSHYLLMRIDDLSDNSMKLRLLKTTGVYASFSGSMMRHFIPG